MKKRARRSSAPNRSNKKNSSDSGCICSAIKAIFMISFWTFTLIYWLISSLTGSKPVNSEILSSNISPSRSVGNASQSDDEYQAVGLYKPIMEA